MTTVTFGNGLVVSDDDNDDHGMMGKGGYGYTTLLFLAFEAFLLDVQAGLQAAADAIAAASTALNAPGTSATSSSSLTVGDGDKNLTLNETGKAFALGQDVSIARTSAPGTRMIGVITAFDAGAGTMTVNVPEDNYFGSGTHSDWTIALAGPPAATGSSVPPDREVVGGGLASGGGDLSQNRTITVTRSSTAQVRAGTNTSTVPTPADLVAALAPVAVPYASSVALDLSTGFKWTIGQLTGNITLANPTGGMDPGRPVTIRLSADSTAGRTISFGSYFKRPFNSPATITMVANGKVTLVGEVVSATEIEITDIRYA